MDQLTGPRELSAGAHQQRLPKDPKPALVLIIQVNQFDIPWSIIQIYGAG
jgi:hypothetical protein